MANSPAFQYYPADLISDPEVMFWDMEMLGAYWQMITFLWLNDGKFEFTLEKIRKIFRKKTEKTAKRLWKKIEKKFLVEDGIVTHRRVTKEMQRQAEYKLKRSKAGKKGMESRWHDDNKCYDFVITNGITKNNSSSSSSSSSSSINNNTIYNYESKEFENITSVMMEKWAEAYPAVNIEMEIKRAAIWAGDNPSKRKKQWGRFLSNWFKRNQERGVNKERVNPPSNKDAEYAAARKKLEESDRRRAERKNNVDGKLY